MEAVQPELEQQVPLEQTRRLVADPAAAETGVHCRRPPTEAIAERRLTTSKSIVHGSPSTSITGSPP